MQMKSVIERNESQRRRAEEVQAQREWGNFNQLKDIEAKQKKIEVQKTLL